MVAGGATVCYGAAARFLGILAMTMTDWESAEQHFQEAIELDSRTRAWPWLAHSQFEYANMLLLTNRVQNRERANALLHESLRAAKNMGMVYLATKIADLQNRYELVSSQVSLG